MSNKYFEIRDKFNSRPTPYMFWAFNRDQFAKGLEKLKSSGWKTDDEKLVSIGLGGYTTHRGLKQLDKEIAEHYEEIRSNCDPQWVYNYECDNHESEINAVGDAEALSIIVNIWGEETASNIKRKHNYYSLEEVIKQF